MYSGLRDFKENTNIIYHSKKIPSERKKRILETYLLDLEIIFFKDPELAANAEIDYKQVQEEAKGLYKDIERILHQLS